MRAWLISVVVVAGCGGSVESDTSRPESSLGGSAGESTGGQSGSGGAAGSSSGGNAGENTGAQSGSGGSAYCGRVPTEHRAVGEACDQTRPPSIPVPADGGLYYDSNCASDADCTAGENGRCENFREMLECTYDECFSDSDCAGAGPCGCERGFWSDSNVCMAGNCRTDGDCGPGGYCSPTLSDCGNYSGVVGYYCHTCEDECTNDQDCVSPEMGAGYCMYSPEVSHWVCGYSHCVG